MNKIYQIGSVLVSANCEKEALLLLQRYDEGFYQDLMSEKLLIAPLEDDELIAIIFEEKRNGHIESGGIKIPPQAFKEKEVGLYEDHPWIVSACASHWAEVNTGILVIHEI